MFLSVPNTTADLDATAPPVPGIREFYCFTCECVTAFQDIEIHYSCGETSWWGWCENEHHEELTDYFWED